MKLEPVATILVFHPDGRAASQIPPGSPMVINESEFESGQYQVWTEPEKEEKGKKKADAKADAKAETKADAKADAGETDTSSQTES
jgi:hypothetical protein